MLNFKMVWKCAYVFRGLDPTPVQFSWRNAFFFFLHCFFNKNKIFKEYSLQLHRRLEVSRKVRNNSGGKIKQNNLAKTKKISHISSPFHLDLKLVILFMSMNCNEMDFLDLKCF